MNIPVDITFFIIHIAGSTNIYVCFWCIYTGTHDLWLFTWKCAREKKSSTLIILTNESFCEIWIFALQWYFWHYIKKILYNLGMLDRIICISRYNFYVPFMGIIFSGLWVNLKLRTHVPYDMIFLILMPN